MAQAGLCPRNWMRSGQSAVARGRCCREAQGAVLGSPSLWLLSLGEPRESDPLAKGEWKLCLKIKTKKELDYTLLLSRALRAIRFANVRFAILSPQSRLRGNDELNSSREFRSTDQ
jgi:hypothetical protein